MKNITELNQIANPKGYKVEQVITSKYGIHCNLIKLNSHERIRFNGSYVQNYMKIKNKVDNL